MFRVDYNSESNSNDCCEARKIVAKLDNKNIFTQLIHVNMHCLGKKFTKKYKYICIYKFLSRVQVTIIEKLPY